MHTSLTMTPTLAPRTDSPGSLDPIARKNTLKPTPTLGPRTDASGVIETIARLNTLQRFLLYGAAGWTLEVGFTGLCSAIEGDRSATAKTYLWMHPIYGGAGLLIEGLLRRMSRAPRLVRGLASLAAIYAAELGTGMALRKLLGRVPWDYSKATKHTYGGLVRYDYAPGWLAVGLAFDALVNRVSRTAEKETPAQAEPAREAKEPSCAAGI
jgi:hypothetical protein